MAVGFGLCIATVWSCADGGTAHRHGAHSGDPASAHAVHSSRLHSIMSRLGRTTAKTWPQEIEAERAADAEQARAQRFEEARQLAAAMSGAADQIPAVIADVQLEPADRQQFLAQVELLRGQARDLEGAAGRHDFEGMRATLQSVRATCNGCHSQFRPVAGPIKLPRSAI
jgi:cytochrome c556